MKHRISYSEDGYTATCSCGEWDYHNSVKSDVKWQAKCHRDNSKRRDA